VYKTVKIGEQVWMAENLNTDRFRNGDIIPEAKNVDEWNNYIQAEEPAWCYSNFNTKNGIKYGKIYNWYAITDTRELASAGFKIPMNSEWDSLFNFLGGIDKAAIKLKSKRGWGEDELQGGTNSSGFNALPGSARITNIPLRLIHSSGLWWSLAKNEKDSVFEDSIKKIENKFYLPANVEIELGRYDNNKLFHQIIRTKYGPESDNRRGINVKNWRYNTDIVSQGYYVRLIKQ